MNVTNEIDWKIYESLTKYIYETLRKDYKINIESYGHTCRIKGISGVMHQVDVLTSEVDGLHTYRTAIECKYWKNKVNKDIVMKLLSIINDTDIQRGIIVSKNGFTSDAQKFAEHHNIKIVQLRELNKHDNVQAEVECGIIDFFFKINIRRPEITKILAKTINDIEISIPENLQYQVLIENRDEVKIKLFDSMMVFKELLHTQKEFKIISKSYSFPGHILYLSNDKHYINSITYEGLLTIINDDHKKTFSLVDKVWMIMNQIFEQQAFLITKNGIIVNKNENLSDKI
ncbi:restriction endonuclease [Chryseobacterium sp. LC2016-27]|uniref:restriction endonuclease n=1 Tax=Chryseobacterium sp. LC2016-27 TaxID=2897326 RepID=UPI001E293285|nr:restriction endonuclease [Chryseobacterium sp. LC2016-27]MCD0456283.1 restriction endonuclease [Chryseobacterium sp. LC2016-27]